MVQWVKSLASVSSISRIHRTGGKNYHLKVIIWISLWHENIQTAIIIIMLHYSLLLLFIIKNNDDNNNIDHTTIKVIYKVTIWYNNLTSGYLAKSTQIKDINRFLFIQSHSSPHDSSRVEAIQVFIGRRVDKMWCTCTHIHKEKDALLQTYNTNPQRM